MNCSNRNVKTEQETFLIFVAQAQHWDFLFFLGFGFGCVVQGPKGGFDAMLAFDEQFFVEAVATGNLPIATGERCPGRAKGTGYPSFKLLPR